MSATKRMADPEERYRMTAARTAARRAVTDGTIQPASCEVGRDCKGSVEMHHDDYDKPLEVRWLCRRHHQRWHVRQMAW